MASRAGLSGLAVAEIGLGVILAWSGIENAPISATLRSLLAGQAPAEGAPTSSSASASSAASSGSGPVLIGESAIASDALRYRGAGYVWAGVPDLGIGNWDCSSFANWVCGNDNGLAIPGYPAGTYHGQAHGPPTGAWLLWPGLRTVGGSGAASAAGDLCVWQTHMGIAIGGGQMISAQNPADGTQVSAIDGFIPGEILFVRRYLASSGTAAPQSG
jgi:peptidoglycan DL-endopeptidase CwlO